MTKHPSRNRIYKVKVYQSDGQSHIHYFSKMKIRLILIDIILTSLTSLASFIVSEKSYNKNKKKIYASRGSRFVIH